MRQSPCEAVIVARTGPVTWNWLGKKGSSEYRELVVTKPMLRRIAAEALAEEWRSTKYEDRLEALSNEIGNNEHLRGVSYYNVVDVVPATCEEI